MGRTSTIIFALVALLAATALLAGCAKKAPMPDYCARGNIAAVYDCGGHVRLPMRGAINRSFWIDSKGKEATCFPDSPVEMGPACVEAMKDYPRCKLVATCPDGSVPPPDTGPHPCPSASQLAACNQTYDPVCANGVSYGNSCQACKVKGVATYIKGECIASTSG